MKQRYIYKKNSTGEGIIWEFQFPNLIFLPIAKLLFIDFFCIFLSMHNSTTCWPCNTNLFSFYTSGQESMAPKSYLALTRRQILADFLQSIAKQQILLRRVFQSYHWCCFQLSYSLTDQLSVKLEEFLLPCGTNAQLYGSHGNPISHMRLLWLCQSKQFQNPGLYY